MELMPAWEKWGYKKGIKEGIEQGQEDLIQKLLAKGIPPEQLAELLDIPAQDLHKVRMLNRTADKQH